MRNERLEAWILLVAAHTSPERIHWCDGSDAELAELRALLQADGTLLPLNEGAYPGCFLQRTHSGDAGPLEHRRFVSTASKADAGPTNQWLAEDEAYRIVWPLFSRAMSGRTLFVVPYLLGSPRSKYAQVGVQLTDSPLVVLQMALLTRMGRVALEHLGRSSDFARGLHCLADCDPERRFLVRFPATQVCWSIGTAYPKDATLLESHVLSLASSLAPEEGYLAEHMSVARVTHPEGAVHYVAAAFPSGCGKTRLATLTPSLRGWRVELVADGLCLLRAGEDGRLWALNPAAGIDSRVGDGSPPSDPGWASQARAAVFTNVAVRRDGSPWWESSGEPGGEGVRDWQGRPWRSGTVAPAAHPNARFIMSAQQCPRLSRLFHDPEGVPLSAILFGGRRPALLPLVFEAVSWEHGVYVAATSRSEAAPGSAGAAGMLHNDPMGMLPFCSYNMADYFGHWLRLGPQLYRPPRIFHVNWFRTDARDRLLWPGFAENIRVLDWVLRRVERRVDARRTPIGLLPRSLDTSGLDLDAECIDQLLQVDLRGWLREAEASQEFLTRFEQRLPRALEREQQALMRRLRTATN
ncbi:MAG: phosphoenolpyruvate carboxykinase (GTP) [Deltaproteobacteria bacterium]